MSARIYQRPKNAMQSGKALVDQWILEFAPAEARKPDPLMGWAGSGDMQAQVVLKFPSKDDAKAYAEKYGISARVHVSPPKRLKMCFPMTESETGRLNRLTCCWAQRS